MKTIYLKDLSKKEYQRIINRSAGTYQAVTTVVKKIMEDVKQNGDKALVNYFRKFNGNSNYSIKVTKEELDKAYNQVDVQVIFALRQMFKNIAAVCKNQLKTKKDRIIETEKGIRVWREWRAIEKVGLYIPGGKAVYPSSLLMTAIPAKIAGCKEIIICTPPQPNGQINPVVLLAAEMLGIKQIYKVGGAEAIAAMVYGTQTIPNVYKIFGAGNTYVTAAKILALEKIAIDMPAGPSEVFIITDETANPKFIAADLLADGEHGEDSACVLLTTSQKVAEETIQEIEKQLPKLTTQDRVKISLEKYGLFAVVDSLDEAIKFSNEYAPEHLEIMTRNPEKLVGKITNAGSVFLGNYTSKSSGDYATGANHILPTGGMAKMYPPLGVDAFGKWMQVQKCTKKGLLKIKETIETVATMEQLPAHKNSASIRFEGII
ncbi:TPA: histidinol dehydrogenase [Candidatus Daviesbacteria bacterium]|uniref:Histidinol dehydrogenase n=1 Tax=Candidatus Daviesbacteria bacterium GW2011_GWF2_38_6 TaxID=1618432 RepID=A0A0G0KPL3_9BACT|nr:MAG: Histidinol dehydrogenase [Candidatus Daviesbacteria bacterium GW2011_GWF2_38_6]OGE26309.1 MAG: histidinol dehydrogenase [Candidatus Daviesbacteria bacterium RIFCSPHIGHO2_02_FULL_39_41]OGE44678.1 MAG: histidinol dehydrogenase [Candidatus Daviesbacteria bacterium RIFCSPHIGHO2_12_FULL_38_25]OGE68891.1 MAG: histidinol dehydrogenase [Candidatus Daviesbacteria bacterium RIFCSPLOWO2_02_FULL_38_18]OGE73400.1 MAG: histidinol dehydrogenase [Candidatus Daviesbacteria bacterium RIFCSPLOWO2_12_FULL_